MAGQYAKFRGKLPAFEPDSNYQQKVDATRNLFSSLESTQALAKQLVKEKELKDKYEEKLKIQNLRIEALSAMLVNRFEDEAIEKVELRGGISVYLNDGIYPSVQSRDELFAWIKKTRQPELLSVHYQTLKGLCGDLLKEGKAAPPGVQIFLKTQARVRRPGNGDDSE